MRNGADERDEELVRRYLGGDATAFAELVRRHETRVYNLCFRLLGNREDARDAAQDTFLSLVRKLKGFRGEAAFSTWLYRVTANACHDALRRRRRQPRTLELVQEGPAEPAADDDPSRAGDAADVQRALLQVPEEFRAAVVLHDVQDLEYAEIATILGIPVGTVKSRIHRGRVALARALGLREPGEPPGPSKGADG